LKIVLPKTSLFNDIRCEIRFELVLVAMVDQKGDHVDPLGVIDGIIIFYNHHVYLPLWSPILGSVSMVCINLMVAL
jgi:hypothetical protein